MEVRENGRGGSGENRVELFHDGEKHLGTAIVQAVSRAADVPVEAMEDELNDVVDPDALNHLFADRIDGRPRKGGTVAFTMEGCDVTVSSEGRIVVTR
jgi:hypothetical protein